MFSQSFHSANRFWFWSNHFWSFRSHSAACRALAGETRSLLSGFRFHPLANNSIEYRGVLIRDANVDEGTRWNFRENMADFRCFSVILLFESAYFNFCAEVYPHSEWNINKSHFLLKKRIKILKSQIRNPSPRYFRRCKIDSKSLQSHLDPPVEGVRMTNKRTWSSTLNPTTKLSV